MAGAAGNDTYIVDNAGDKVLEAAGLGTDSVIATKSYILQIGSSVEVLRTTGTSSTYAVNLVGNELANTIQGNAAGNVLIGKGGSDTLSGFAGSDTFVFNTALGAANVDKVTDYNVAADTIQIDNAVFAGLAVGTLPVGAFRIGAAAADANDRIIYNSANGGLSFDADGNGAGRSTAFALLATGLALTNNDFVVI
jgi:Ca2+-binding RTX toxin-like protein